MFGKMLKERGFGDAIMKIAGVKQCVRLGLALIDDRYEEREGERGGKGRCQVGSCTMKLVWCE